LISSILPKNEQKNSLNHYDTSGEIVFIHFLEELETPKRHFEINWSLMIFCGHYQSYDWFVHACSKALGIQLHNGLSAGVVEFPTRISAFFISKSSQHLVVSRTYWTLADSSKSTVQKGDFSDLVSVHFLPRIFVSVDEIELFQKN